MIALLAKLLIAHALCDFPLQGDFMARAKDHLHPIAGVPSWWVLACHAMIHAGAVWYLTGSGAWAFAEFGLHIGIDTAKCSGRTTFATDQVLHVACKAFYVLASA